MTVTTNSQRLANEQAKPPRRAKPIKHGQRGGTILGFIVGGVVGLLAALIVAVYVTKVPVPFVNKAVNRNAEQDAAEAVKNKNWDPNAPLATKQAPKASEAAALASAPVGVASSPVKPGEKVVEKVPEKLPEKLPEKVAEKVNEKLAEKPPKAPSADPLGDLVKAKTAQASAPAKDSDAFFVQAGAYTTADDAEAQRARLSLGGFESKVTEREVSGRTVFRVRVGPIDKKADADRTRERLEGMGVEARVMSVSR